MSIKGIDTQIMITRSADFAREASAMQKRPEMTQDFLAVKQKMNDAHDQSRVKGTEQTEMEGIRTDVEGGAGSGYDSFEGEQENEEDGQDGEIPPGLRVPPGNNLIDIKI